MRRNAQRIDDLKNELLGDIFKWFFTKPTVLQIELKNEFTAIIDSAGLVGDYDFDAEEFKCRKITNDGFIVDDEENEIRLDELTLWELGYILDEIEANNFTTINE